MSDTYYVVIRGIRQGLDKNQVITELAQLFKTSEQDINTRFLQPVFVVKRGLDFTTAEKYKSSLEQRGCIVEILSNSNVQTKTATSSDIAASTNHQTSSITDSITAKNISIPEKNFTRAFKVRFGINSKFLINAPNSFKYYGKGNIEINQDKVKIRGKRYRFCWFGAPQEHEFSNTFIRNARASGKYVRFEIDNLGSKTVIHVGFLTSSNREAAEIADLLPNSKTDAFTKEQAELSDFKNRLDHLSPNTPVTPIIVGLNIVIFLFMAYGGAGIFVSNPEVVVKWGSNFGPLTLEGQWWRLFSSTFIHFGILHLLLNMLALYQSGRMVERMLGSFRYLMLYIFAGLTGSATSLLWNPVVNSAGASGAIFGVFGGLLVFMLRPQYGVPASVMSEHRNSTMAFIGFNLIYGFSHNGIDNGAHIGGLLGGMLMAFLLARPINIDQRAKATSNQLIYASLVGLLTLGMMGLAMQNPSNNTKQEIIFAQARLTYKDQEDQAIAITKQILKDHNPVNNQEAFALANALEIQVVPKWDRMYESISAAKLSTDSKNYARQQVLIKFLADKRDGTKLLVNGIKNNDSAMLRQSSELVHDAELQIENLKKLK